MSVPRLSVAALTHQLSRMFAGGREHRPLIAIHGTCDDPRPIDLPGVGRFDVVLADSELTLRCLVPGPAEPAPRTVYLVPWTHHLPLDIAGRFVHDGRVFHVDAEVRLSRFFTAPFETIDADVPASRIAAWLLREPPSAPLPSPGGRLTHDALWDAWLQHQWGIDLGEGGLSGLLAWAASSGLGPRMAGALARDAAAGVQDELEALLRRRLGEPAPAILRAWLRERGPELLGFAVLCETLAPRAEADRAVRTWLALKAEAFLGPLPAPRQQQLLRRLGGLVPPTLGELGRTGQRTVLRAALDAADALADEHVRGPLIESARLLSSWQQRLAALGEVLSEAALKPSHDHLQRAIAALRSLEQHDRPRYSRDSRASAELARAEAGVRLLAWLVVRDIPALVLPNRSERAEGLARWYVEEGGYLDSARRTARGAGDDRLGVGIAAILARVDAERRELDRKFADGLVAWNVSRAPSRAIPIAQALDKIAVRFLQGRPERRLLTILLDGMAWMQAIELLTSLDDDASRWAPLVWHAHEGKLGDGPYPAVFAAVPSITQLSRSAFFAGKPMLPGSLPATSGDPKRLAEHRGLKNLLPGNVAPPLFLRGALDDDGSAGSEVLAQIRDPRMRFVGVVVNAIDASLGSDPQQSAAWRARDIRPLFDLLDAAQAAGRAVLLASDHGHVPGDRLQYTGKHNTKAAPRWRPWTDEKVIQDYETTFLADDTWGPRESKGVILVNDEEHRYTPSSAHTGEHGGATLAEIVAPTLLIGWENMAAELGDEALVIRAAAPPRWWHLLVDRPPPRETRPPRPSARKDPGPQLGLAGVPAPETPPPPASIQTTPAEHPLVRRLADSAVFAARALDPVQRDMAIRAVAALMANERSAPDTILGPALGVPARRVGGFISKASEVLNVDGYAVLQFDPLNHRADLHVERMIQCFELAPT